MIDFVLGASLAAGAVRGWRRGLVREVMDLVGLALGVVVAFRLSRPAGDYLHTTYGLSPETARVVAAVGLFVAVGLAAGIVAHFLTRVMSIPGLSLANRLGGAGMAVLWTVFLVLVVASVARALPLSGPLDDAMARSRVLSAIAAPDALPQVTFQRLAGDRVLDSVLALEDLFNQRRLVVGGEDSVSIEPAEPDDLAPSAEDARLLLDLINSERVSVGLDPLAWSDGLAVVAAAHADDMYRHGFIAHRSPSTGTVNERVESAGIPVNTVAENLALAASGRAVHAGLMESQGHRSNLLGGGLDRVGIAALQGPLGLMVVEIFAG